MTIATHKLYSPLKYRKVVINTCPHGCPIKYRLYGACCREKNSYTKKTVFAPR